MALHNKLNTVIHASANAVLSAYTYSQVYASAAATPTINGTSVSMAAGTTLDIVIKNISSTPNVYVLGSPKNTITGSENLGLING